MVARRIIGQYSGTQPGPVLICTAGLHGNETAGVKALEYVFKMLEVEPITNPGFQFTGHLIGLAGNLKGIQKGVRFIDHDMNRLWMPDKVARIKTQPIELLGSEEREVQELLRIIEHVFMEHPDAPIVVMDMHTTTADGGIFTIATEDPESVRLATALHAPVILGMLSGLEGTTMHYFHRDILHRDIMTFAFEAGRHEDPVSMNRSIAAIIACLRAMGMVQPEDVANVHDNLLIAYSEGLPQIAELIEVYKIKDQEQFALLPGFLNFQPVQKGQTLAYDCGEAVVAKEDGRILMPRYQQQGDDGFFLLRVLVE